MAGTHTMSPGNRNRGVPMAGGTLGGLPPSGGGRSSGRRPSFSLPSSFLPSGDTAYLWGLIAAEVLAIAWLRKAFKRYHGG
jgi:hypothetical protein